MEQKCKFLDRVKRSDEILQYRGSGCSCADTATTAATAATVAATNGVTAMPSVGGCVGLFGDWNVGTLLLLLLLLSPLLLWRILALTTTGMIDNAITTLGRNDGAPSIRFLILHLVEVQGEMERVG